VYNINSQKQPQYQHQLFTIWHLLAEYST